jgi:ABC-2 type transport system ATP-binding protein
VSSTAAIEVRGLTKFYGSSRGVEDLSLRVEAGEVMGFLGPNGAGKTTTIRMLLDLIRPSAGSMRILGLDPRTDGVTLRRRLGYLPGELAFAERLTARALLRHLGALRDAHDELRTAALADDLHLDLDRPIRTLSRGNRQKIGLIQAFSHDPDVLLLDEPTSGLDPLMQRAFEGMVRAATTRGAAVLLSSHILSEVQDVADRAAIIRDGRLVAVEDIAELRRKALHRMEIRFAQTPPVDDLATLPGVRDVAVNGTALRCTVEGRADPLIKTLSRHDVESITSTQLDLEELFLAHYEDPDAT